MNDIYEIGVVIICFGVVILFTYFEDKKVKKILERNHMKQTMFESLVEEFPKQEKQLDTIFRKLGLDKSLPNPESGARRSGKTTKRRIRLLSECFY